VAHYGSKAYLLFRSNHIFTGMFLGDRLYSAVAEMGDRDHNRHGLKEGALCPFHGALGTLLIQCGLCGGLHPYQVVSSSIQPFGHNSVGCHSPRWNISTYYFVVEMHTVTVCSDDAPYILKNSTNCLV